MRSSTGSLMLQQRAFHVDSDDDDNDEDEEWDDKWMAAAKSTVVSRAASMTATVEASKKSITSVSNNVQPTSPLMRGSRPSTSHVAAERGSKAPDMEARPVNPHSPCGRLQLSDILPRAFTTKRQI
jgi:hypothetical protein